VVEARYVVLWYGTTKPLHAIVATTATTSGEIPAASATGDAAIVRIGAAACQRRTRLARSPSPASPR
jgi:hypothetical protein